MVCWKAESLNSVLSFVLSPFLTSTRWLKGGLQKVRSRKLAAATASATIMWKLFCESEKENSSKWSGWLLLFLGAWSMEPMASSGGPVQQQDGQPSNEDDHATRLVFFWFLAPFFVCFDAFLMVLLDIKSQNQSLLIKKFVKVKQVEFLISGAFLCLFWRIFNGFFRRLIENSNYFVKLKQVKTCSELLLPD